MKTKGILFILLTLVFASCHKDTPQEPEQVNQKTLFMYFPWSGNLTSYFYQNIEDMEETIARIGLENERVVVFLSTSSSEAEMFEITTEDGICTRNTLKEYSNPPITTREGIAAILNDMKTFAPAPVYAMTIGCHGMGWVPVEKAEARSTYRIAPHWEYTDGPLTRYFGGTTAEYQTDITTLAEGLQDAQIVMEYILFDDCYMSSIEAAYDLRFVTDHIIACPTEIMAYGMPYSSIGEYLLGDPDYQAISQGFYDFYSTYRYPYGTLGITDCRELDALAGILKDINRLRRLRDQAVRRYRPAGRLQHAVGARRPLQGTHRAVLLGHLRRSRHPHLFGHHYLGAQRASVGRPSDRDQLVQSHPLSREDGDRRQKTF